MNPTVYRIFETIEHAREFAKTTLHRTLRKDTLDQILYKSYYAFLKKKNKETITEFDAKNIQTDSFIKYITTTRKTFHAPRMIKTHDEKWIVFWNERTTTEPDIEEVVTAPKTRAKNNKNANKKAKRKATANPNPKINIANPCDNTPVSQKTSPRTSPRASPKTSPKEKKSKTTETAPKRTTVLRTEDTGKKFEMAVCVAFKTEYKGTYKYDMELADKLKPRLVRLLDYFPAYYHTAGKHGRYDFTSTSNENDHISVKTTKGKVSKVAPQVIGQPKPERFCELLQIPYIGNDALKLYIQQNQTTILPLLWSYTFDCPTLYYNDSSSSIILVKPKEEINWNDYKYSWTRDWSDWNNSCTLRIHSPKNGDSGVEIIDLVEFQFHSKSRTNMAIRWCFENVLKVFRDRLDIISL
jgi:hypothetical protein